MNIEPNIPTKGKQVGGASQSEPKRVSLTHMAREALEECGNSVSNAVELLVQRMLDDVPLLRGALTEVVSIAAQELVQRDIHSQRRAIQAGVTRPKIDGKRAVEIQAANYVRSLMDYPLADGTLLRNATRDLVERQRDEHALQAQRNARKANWFAAIADALPEGKTVGEALSEKQVRKFFDKAFQ